MVICASVFRNDKSVRHDVLRKTLVIVHHLPHLLGVGLFYCFKTSPKLHPRQNKKPRNPYGTRLWLGGGEENRTPLCMYLKIQTNDKICLSRTLSPTLSFTRGHIFPQNFPKGQVDCLCGLAVLSVYMMSIDSIGVHACGMSYYALKDTLGQSRFSEGYE